MFVAASAACALAWSPVALVVARGLQGLGSAVLSPAALALLSTITAPGAVRRRPVGWWTAAAATGGGSGWVAGGLITACLGWPWVFWVNVPIGLLTLIAARRTLPPGARTGQRRINAAGPIILTVTLSLLVWSLTSIAQHGILAPQSWAPVLLGGWTQRRWCTTSAGSTIPFCRAAWCTRGPSSVPGSSRSR